VRGLIEINSFPTRCSLGKEGDSGFEKSAAPIKESLCLKKKKEKKKKGGNKPRRKGEVKGGWSGTQRLIANPTPLRVSDKPPLGEYGPREGIKSVRDQGGAPRQHAGRKKNYLIAFWICLAVEKELRTA